MGEEENYFEKYAPLPSTFDGRSGKTKLGANSETLVYAGVILLALVALTAFVYFIVLPYYGSGFSAKNSPPVALEPSKVYLDYKVTLDDGTVVSEGSNKEFIQGGVGRSLGVLSDIDTEINGMAPGSETTLSLPPKEAFGEYDLAKVTAINRTENIERRSNVNKTVTATKTDFESQFGKKAELGQEYSVDGLPWKYKVISIQGEEVTVLQDAKVGQIVPISDVFFLLVSEVSENHIVTMLTAENQTLEVPTGNLTISNGPTHLTLTLTPPLGARIPLGIGQQLAKVLRYDGDKIYLDSNAEYAGKNITIKLKKTN